jgi:hypothetical protein
VARERALGAADENGTPARRIKDPLLGRWKKLLLESEERESPGESGFDEGFELDLAVDDFNNVLDVAAILLFL